MDKVSLEHVWVAIIAGGEGTRLFPYSNPDRPKQFCIINHEKKTFIQNVIDNFSKIGIKRNRIVVITTNEVQTELAKEQVLSKGVISQNIHQISPGLDYGGAMIEATKFVKSLDKEAIVINTPADQYIEISDNYKSTIENAIFEVSKNSFVVIGVKVNDLKIATGCGHAIYKEDDSNCHKVLSFVEKPSEAEATKIMRAGNSACSTGISIWKTKAFFKYIPDGNVTKMGTNALMDKLPDLKVAVGDFEWYDCGTLKSLYTVSKKTPHHKNASFGGGEIDRFKSLHSLFLCDEGYRLHAAGCEGVAVVVTTIRSHTAVAVIGLEQSEIVKELAQEFARNEKLLTHDFSTRANNNYVLFSNMSEDTISCFACVNGYSINTYRNDDGTVEVFVSGKHPA